MKKNTDREKKNFDTKKIIWVLFVGIMLIGLAACNKSPTASQTLSYSLYIPNDNADGFDVETIHTENISEKAVLTELQKRNILPDTVSMNSFNIDDGLITIDFNQAFSDVLCSMGTSGELMIVGSVVNTFLDAFQAESVYFTVNGQILESGHTIYDFAMSFFSLASGPAN